MHCQFLPKPLLLGALSALFVITTVMADPVPDQKYDVKDVRRFAEDVVIGSKPGDPGQIVDFADQ